MRYFFEPIGTETNTQQYPCGICSQNVPHKQEAIQCDFCNFWNHIKCENIDIKTYNDLIKSNDSETHCCKVCKAEMNLCSPVNLSDDEILMIDLNLLKTPEFISTAEVFHCGTCKKKVGQRHKAVQCDFCDKWNHIKCDGIDNKTYDALKKSNDNTKYYCKLCKENIFPFQKLADDEFFTSIIKAISTKEDLNLNLTPSSTLKALFND